MGGLIREVIVVDAGSTDATVAIADEMGAQIVTGVRGRGAQLAAGAAQARGRWLLFLHADTGLAPDWPDAVLDFLRAGGTERAAAFTLAFDEDGPAARRTAGLANWRARTLGLPYGDQGLLISRSFHDALGGFRDMALMEDVDMVRRIGRRRLTILPTVAATSAARYRRDGWLRRSIANIALVVLFHLGADPAWLKKLYG
jgi:rSAM/selenodomain-associated transferase 2